MGILTRIRSEVKSKLQDKLSSTIIGRASAGKSSAKHGSKIGVQFTNVLEKEWEEIPEQVDAYTKKVGSAIVGSWEVAAAEIGRTVIGLPNDQVLIDRFSDALVPTLSPFQDLHKKAPTSCKNALKAARTTGDVRSLGPEIQKLAVGLGPSAREGWAKTVEYLEPLIELSRDPGLKQRMLEAGPKLEQVAVAAEAILQERLSNIQEETTLFGGVCDSVEAWQLALCRDLELALDVPTQHLIKALKNR